MGWYSPRTERRVGRRALLIARPPAASRSRHRADGRLVPQSTATQERGIAIHRGDQELRGDAEVTDGRSAWPPPWSQTECPIRATALVGFFFIQETRRVEPDPAEDRDPLGRPLCDPITCPLTVQRPCLLGAGFPLSGPRDRTCIYVLTSSLNVMPGARAARAP